MKRIVLSGNFRRLIWVAALVLFMGLPAASASSIWYVDGVNGNDNNDCKTRQTACKTIGHAISLAKLGDTIGIGPATYNENITFGSLKLIGSGANTTIIDGGGGSTVVTVRGISILSRITIRNGSAVSGGGIANFGDLTINNTVVSGNTATGGSLFSPCGGGGIYNDTFGVGLIVNNSTITGNRAIWGGGICNRGNLTINNSTLSGNSANPMFLCYFAHGGGIYALNGEATINNSTISGNNAISSGADFCHEGADGGGISGTVTINNSTISDNAAYGRWGGIGGGISRSATLQNTIVADNTSGGNCSGTMTSNGYNLSSDGTCNFSGPGDLNNTNPKLGTLGNYGGPTQTVPLLSGSPAIDAGNPIGCSDENGRLLKTDQRGAPRPDKEDTGGCDMGAYERQQD